MGLCRYCGQKTGLFSNAHKECKEIAKNHINKICRSLEEIKNASNLNSFSEKSILEIDQLKIPVSEVVSPFSNSLKRLADKFLTDNLIDENEETIVATLLEQNSAFLKPEISKAVAETCMKSIVLRELSNGRLPTGVNLQNNSVILRKDEQPIWLFPNCKMYKYKTQSTYVGKSRGTSFRIAKGIYYRVGQSSGHKLSQEVLVEDDVGSLLVTSKAIHYKGSKNSFKLEFSKIQSVEPWKDALEISDTKQTSKPRIFGVVDPSFAANLIMNLIYFE